MTVGELSGKVAFITGAARGQGRAHAVKLSSMGADIIAVDLCDQIASVPYPMATADDLAATVKLVEDNGTRIVAHQADVRDRAALKTAVKAGVEEFGGRLDIVVANAGIAPMAGEDAWQDVIDVNLTGVYHTIDVAMRPMIKAGNGGSIVLTSSVAGLVGLAAPQAGSIGYAAAKHGCGTKGQRASTTAQGDGEYADVNPAVARNYTWTVLKKSPFFAPGGNLDRELAQYVMTLVGTIIYVPPKDATPGSFNPIEGDTSSTLVTALLDGTTTTTWTNGELTAGVVYPIPGVRVNNTGTAETSVTIFGG